jgi:hypothetical protein
MGMPRCISGGADLSVWDDAPLPRLPTIACNVCVRAGAGEAVDGFARTLADAYGGGRATAA